MHKKIVRFLKEELAVPEHLINLAVNNSLYSAQYPHFALWDYGVITFEQVEQAYLWLQAQDSD